MSFLSYFGHAGLCCYLPCLNSSLRVSLHETQKLAFDLLTSDKPQMMYWDPHSRCQRSGPQAAIVDVLASTRCRRAAFAGAP